MDTNSLNPYIRVAMRSVIGPGGYIPQRIIFDYELIYVEKGLLLFTYNGISYRCDAGTFLLIRPGIPHSFYCPEDAVSQPHIHFDLAYQQNSSQTPVSFKDEPMMTDAERSLIREDVFFRYPKIPFVTFSDGNTALPLFFRVIDSFSSGRDFTAKAGFMELLDLLLTDNFPNFFSADLSSRADVMQQVKDYIDSSCGIRITLDALEKQFCYSKFYLERRFKEQYGMSLISYSNNKKLELACVLLRDQTVTDVAEYLGFSSIYSFSRAFKNKYGLSPLIYKKERVDT